jgi:purine-cytosine permease-like protein
VALVLPIQDLVTALLLAQGGLIALSLILIDEVDNAYGDAYSGSVSAHSLWPRWSVRRWGVVVALACTAFALVLPMHSLEPFLLLLSSVFVPLFGVILGRLAFGAHAGALLRNARGVHGLPVVLWLAGIACYHLLPRVLPGMGAALPTLAVCFVLAFATRPRNATE